MDREFPHAVVRHSDGQYVVGAVHTNTIEGFWSLVKRGMVGTFHKVSAEVSAAVRRGVPVPVQQPENEDIFGEAIRAC